MVPDLLTGRLSLRAASPDDLDALQRIWDDPAVRRFLFDDEPVPRDRAAAVLADVLALSDGLGLWSVRLMGSDKVIGCVGLLPTGAASAYAPGLAGAVEPLAALAPDVWEQGYATEALAQVLAYAFGPLRLASVAAVHDIPNHASGRLVRRLGFVATGECDGPAHRLRTYRLTPDAFARRDA